MDAAKAATLEAELAAKSSRVADLEARVSLLEAENARLRKAMDTGEPVDHTGKKGPVFRRLEDILGGDKQKSVEMVGGRVSHDVIEVSDGEEEGMAVDVNKERGAEEGVLAVPTPRKCAVRVVTGESEDEDEIEDAEGGDQGSVHCDNYVGLEDDDVSITLWGKKRAVARVITSDSEDDDVNEGGHGDDKDGEVQEEAVGVTPSRKRALRGVSDSENEDGSERVRVVSLEHASCSVATQIENEEDDEDDRIPIHEVVKKMRQERVSENDDELGEAKGCSTPATRRSARLVKSQSKRVRAARRALNFAEPKDYEGSEDDLEEDDDMDEFINDEDCSENAADSAEESSAEPEDPDASAPNEESSTEPEDSDSEINYKDVMACIGRKRNAKDWKYEAEMLSAFAEHPELCLKAVCALYRKQTKDERSEKCTFVHNKRGFNQIDALRGSCTAEFLLDGDAFGPLKKTVHDLEKYDRYGLELCRKLAARYSKQLFAIYQNKEDPYFP